MKEESLVAKLLKSAKIDAESTTAKAAQRLAITLKAGNLSEATQTTILKSLMGGLSTGSVSSVGATQETTTSDLLKAQYGHIEVDPTTSTTADILEARYGHIKR